MCLLFPSLPFDCLAFHSFLLCISATSIFAFFFHGEVSSIYSTSFTHCLYMILFSRSIALGASVLYICNIYFLFLSLSPFLVGLVAVLSLSCPTVHSRSEWYVRVHSPSLPSNLHISISPITLRFLRAYENHLNVNSRLHLSTNKWILAVKQMNDNERVDVYCDMHRRKLIWNWYAFSTWEYIVLVWWSDTARRTDATIKV